MPRYKVYYEGFYMVDCDSAEEAEDMEAESVYDEREITAVEEIDADGMFF